LLFFGVTLERHKNCLAAFSASLYNFTFCRREGGLILSKKILKKTKSIFLKIWKITICELTGAAGNLKNRLKAIFL
jgi:hypothetical protein